MFNSCRGNITIRFLKVGYQVEIGFSHVIQSDKMLIPKDNHKFFIHVVIPRTTTEKNKTKQTKTYTNIYSNIL